MALLLLLSGAAAAAERLSMPYDCRFDGARVRMRPTFDDRSYAIFGRRERQIFSSCAPDDPTSCRSWFVHRFDFDCDGARVSWLEAAGAAARGKNWDAWVADGRFNMRMGHGWGVAPARPLFRRRWGRDRFDDFDADPFGPGGFRDQTSVVTLPEGFAPAMGIELSFSGGEEPPVALAPGQGAAGDVYGTRSAPAPDKPSGASSGWSAAAPESATSPFETTTTVEAPLDAPSAKSASPPQPAAEAAKTIAVPEPVPAAPPAVAASEPSHPAPVTAAPEPHAATPETGTAASPAPATTEVAAAHEVAAASRETSQDAGANVPPRPGNAPTIINEHGIAGPAPEVTQPATKAADAGTGVAAEGTGAMPAGASSLDKLDGAPAAASAPDPETSPLPGAEPGVGAMGALSDYAVPIAASAAVLALAGLAAFGFWRRARAPDAEPPLRDIADISFDSARASHADARALTLPAPASAPAASGVKSLDIEELVMPTDYDEALGVLGANPDALLGDIKKIVDGLRRNWHPDHASSEPDRLYRERRLQQINVAWDLISKQRSAA